MATSKLGNFIGTNREEILRRCRAKMAHLDAAQVGKTMERGIPLFLDQITNQLRDGPDRSAEMQASALQHGRDLFADGFTLGQLIHDYGSVCQSVTDLAVERGATIGSDEFRMLNGCLDDAIAQAVGAYANQESAELRDLVNIANSGFDVLRSGTVGVGGATGNLVARSLASLRDLVEHPQSKPHVANDAHEGAATSASNGRPAAVGSERTT